MLLLGLSAWLLLCVSLLAGLLVVVLVVCACVACCFMDCTWLLAVGCFIIGSLSSVGLLFVDSLLVVGWFVSCFVDACLL